jgi:HK97 family phage major capsid protein
MANYQEMLKQRAHALSKAEGIVGAAEREHRQLTDVESLDWDTAMAAVDALTPQIANIERKNTLIRHFPGGKQVGLLVSEREGGRKFAKGPALTLGADYADAFFDYVASGGKEISAALYEGSGSAGGYAVPITVDDQIVPLAPNEMSVRQLANVIPTVMDIKIPQKGAFGTASLKTETSSFTESDPTLSQITLSAFMAGIQETISWELAQDVPAFQSFCVDDMVLAQQMLEEGFYVTGTGTGQAQGLIGNVGAGVTEEPDGEGNLVSISGTLDLTGTLNAVYHANASWLMTRPTSIIIRKAQVQANLFEPAWTRVGKQDFLHGYPVFYSASMPTAARGACPVLFGDFKRGYVIGDRGGSGINVKVLDQPKAQQGEIVLLAYRRSDGRVRRSEAIQSYNVAAS